MFPIIFKTCDSLVTILVCVVPYIPSNWGGVCIVIFDVPRRPEKCASVEQNDNTNPVKMRIDREGQEPEVE